MRIKTTPVILLVMLFSYKPSYAETFKDGGLLMNYQGRGVPEVSLLNTTQQETNAEPPSQWSTRQRVGCITLGGIGGIVVGGIAGTLIAVLFTKNIVDAFTYGPIGLFAGAAVGGGLGIYLSAIWVRDKPPSDQKTYLPEEKNNPALTLNLSWRF